MVNFCSFRSTHKKIHLTITDENSLLAFNPTNFEQPTEWVKKLFQENLAPLDLLIELTKPNEILKQENRLLKLFSSLWQKKPKCGYDISLKNEFGTELSHHEGVVSTAIRKYFILQ